MKDGKLSQKQKAKLRSLRQKQMKEATYETPVQSQSQKKRGRGRPKKVQQTTAKLSPKQKIMFRLVDLQTQLRKILAGLRLRLMSVLQSLKL